MATPAFPKIDCYHSLRMGLDLATVRPGEIAVVESPKRLQPEQGYGYIRALWWLWLAEGRSVLSVPPGAGDGVRRAVAHLKSEEAVHDPQITERLKAPVNAALRQVGVHEIDRALNDLCFACNGSLLRRHALGPCVRLTDESIPAAEGLRLPTHCFPAGIAYGVIVDGKAVSIAFAHRTGVMEDEVADIGIETAEGYRRRGYAKTAVSAVAAHVIDRGGEARYGCSPENYASVATARSVGFVPYGRSLVLSAPCRSDARS